MYNAQFLEGVVSERYIELILGLMFLLIDF